MRKVICTYFLCSIPGLLLFLAPAIAYSASSSTSFHITRSVFDNGGELTTSSSYMLYSSQGQSSPVGPTSSASFNLYSGFNSIPDTDADGIQDDIENCRVISNANQLDTDLDESGDACDSDDDNDNLDDITENTLGTNPLDVDSDDDGISDFDEVNIDNDPFSYQDGVDSDPNNADTDGDGLLDGVDPDPLIAYIGDGDIVPDGILNAADLLVTERIVLELVTPTAIDRSHGDVYPPGAPDGAIDLSDLLLIRQLILTQP